MLATGWVENPGNEGGNVFVLGETCAARIVTALLAAGAEVNAETTTGCMTALSLGQTGGHTTIIQALRAAGGR